MNTIITITLLTLLTSFDFYEKENQDYLRIAIDTRNNSKDEGMRFNGAVEQDIVMAIAEKMQKMDLGSTIVLYHGSKYADANTKEIIKDSETYDLYISLNGVTVKLQKADRVFITQTTEIIPRPRKGMATSLQLI